MNFVKSIYSLVLDYNAVDAIELVDGRVITIDGESVILYDDMDALRDADGDDDEERPTIPL